MKAVFDKFLDIFQMGGPLIHVLHSCMLLLLKQMMYIFLKQSAIEKKSLSELLKLDVKNTGIQLKDSEHEIGVLTMQALKDVKNSGKQKQCNLGIRQFLWELWLICRRH